MYWNVLQPQPSRCDLQTLLFSATASLTTQQPWTAGKPTPTWISSGRTRQTWPSIPSPPITKTRVQGRARPCGWDVVHMHANDTCARPQEQAHALTQVLSGLTLNKWSIHLGSQNVPSINRCRLISCSSIAAGSKKSLRLLKVTKSWSTTVPGWIKFTATSDWTS